MGDYGAIATTIGEMKRAAIDAYMAQQGWLIDYEYDDRYALWGFIPSWYRRPTEDGEGGGENIPFGGDSMVEGFSNIRSRIDSATSKFVGLPDSSPVAEAITGTGAAATQFGAAASGSSVIADGEVAKSIDTISNTVVSNMRGSFKAPFQDKYDAQFAKVIGGTGAAIAVLQTAYAGEKAIWPAAREDAADICENARNAFRLDAKQSADEIRDLALSVVTSVAAVVTTVATAGTAATIVAVAGFAKTAADTVSSLSTALTPFAVNGYEGIMGALEGACTDLDGAITAQERAFEDMLSSTVDSIASESDAFDLDAYSLPEFELDDMITIDQGDADVVTQNMERLIEAMGDASGALGSVPGSGFLHRDAAVGIGDNGPYAHMVSLHDRLSQALGSTKDEYTRGRDLFEAVVRDHLATDAQGASVAEALQAEMETSG